MPLQHISDDLLKTMKRGANQSRILELLNAMKSDDSFIRTSFIIGHPNESEENQKELMKFIEDFDFDRVTIFVYSDEENTSSYDMNNKISQKIKTKRVDDINILIENKLETKRKSDIDREFSIVIDKTSDEHEYFMDAKKLIWAPDIDGEILINDSEVENLEFAKIYRAIATEIAGDKIIVKVLK
jgi:tRNA A37 methylthiotransferase MiaB